jgi:hypothetical protein
MKGLIKGISGFWDKANRRRPHGVSTLLRTYARYFELGSYMVFVHFLAFFFKGRAFFLVVEVFVKER